MDVVVGLLRAVNVGGRRLTSAQLRDVATRLGCTQVATYVNSGNLVALAPWGPERFAAELGAALTAEAGFDVPVVARSAAQWHALVDALPLPDEARDDPAHLLAVLWDAPPDEPVGEPAGFDPARYGSERLVWGPTELFVHYGTGIADSRLTLKVLEKAVGRTGTGRNWRTVLALDALVRERE